MLDWVLGRGPAPERQNPVVLLCRDGSQRAAVDRWAARQLGCPALWFALGVQAVDVERLGGETSTPHENPHVLSAIAASLETLEQSPLVRMGSRARTLLGEKAPGERPVRLDGRLVALLELERPETFHEVVIVRPRTHQLEGGVSVEIPAPVLEETTWQIAEGLAGTAGAAGWTEVPGSGRWFSTAFGSLVQEEVTRVEVFARIHPAALAPLPGYLRFGWLQDLIFATFDGRSLDDVLAGSR